MSVGYPRPPRPPRGWLAAFVNDEADETAADLVRRLGSPWIVPILSVDPIVYGEPPIPARPGRPLPIADAATCALCVCDALAHLHAAGWVGLGTDSQDIRITMGDGGWRVSIVLPHLPPRGRFSYVGGWNWRLGPVDNDLLGVIGLLRDLVDGYVPVPMGHYTVASAYHQRPLPSLGNERIEAVLREMLALREATVASSLPADAATLGLLLAPLSHTPDTWRAHFEALPKARPAGLRRDWDRLVTLGEAELLHRAGDPYVVYPLARALHQRACATYARGGDGDADLERCLLLDPWCRYRVTRATIAHTRGDHTGALTELDAVIASLRNPNPSSADDLAQDPLRAWSPPRFGGDDIAPEAARALYARGVIRFHLGDLDGARVDLDEAVLTSGMCAVDRPHAPSPNLGLRPHVARVAVLEALTERGDTTAPVELVSALRTCERHDEARAQARRVLSERPDDAKLRRRFERWYPGVTG